MARKAKKARVNPVDWKLDGQKQDDLWRVVDGTGATIGLVSDDLVLAVFAHRHLLEIAKTTRNILKGLGALDVNWANTDHIITGRGVGQMTPDMLKTGVWRSLIQMTEESDAETVSGVPESGGAGEPAGADPVSDPGSSPADTQDENG